MRGHNQTVLEDLNNCDLCCLVQTIQGSSRNWIAIWQNFLDCPFDDSFGKNHFRRLFPKSLPHLCPASLLGHALWILWHLWLSNLLFHPGNFVCHLLWTTVVVQQAMELVWRSDRMTVWDLNFHIFQRCCRCVWCVWLTIELPIPHTRWRASASTCPTFWCNKTISSHSRRTGQDDQIVGLYHHEMCFFKPKS